MDTHGLPQFSFSQSRISIFIYQESPCSFRVVVFVVVVAAAAAAATAVVVVVVVLRFFAN